MFRGEHLNLRKKQLEARGNDIRVLRRFIIRTLTEYYYGDEIKKDETEGHTERTGRGKMNAKL
jgi:hypothetical protein